MMKPLSTKPCTIQKEKEYLKPSIQGTYPKICSYSKDNQYEPEPEIEPKPQDKPIMLKNENLVDFASMIVNLDDHDQDSSQAPKFNNLLVIIEGYLAYMKLHANQATKVNYEAIPEPKLEMPQSLLSELSTHFNFQGVLIFNKMFKKITVPKSAKFKVEMFYARFNPSLEKICNKKLKMLCK